MQIGGSWGKKGQCQSYTHITTHSYVGGTHTHTHTHTLSWVGQVQWTPTRVAPLNSQTHNSPNIWNYYIKLSTTGLGF